MSNKGKHGITQEQLDKPNPWIDNVEFEDYGYQDESQYWLATTLKKAVEDQGCTPYTLPLKHFDMTTARGGWEGCRIWDMAYTARRIMKTSLDHPIIIGPGGNILDGYHRVAKAIALGLKSVQAVRLKEMPEPDEVKD